MSSPTEGGSCAGATYGNLWRPPATLAKALNELVCLYVCRGDAAACGVLVRSWNAGGEGSAVVVYSWERSALEVVFEGGQRNDLGTQVCGSLIRVAGLLIHLSYI